MNSEKCIVVIAGSEDIHRPLYFTLRSLVKQPIYLIGAKNHSQLKEILLKLNEEKEVWAFPSNEVALNMLHSLFKNTSENRRKRLIVPGTSETDIYYTSADISNKAILYYILKDKDFHSFVKIPTIVVSGKDLMHIDSSSIDFFPFIIKPAYKDSEDSFTQAYPSKLLICKTKEEIGYAAEKLKSFDSQRLYLLQKMQEGLNISWYGYACSGYSYGYVIVPIIKSPSNSIGGTTTLAYIKEADSYTQSAVAEIVTTLGLDGIFEIEFILHNNTLYFLFEINPRPVLQTALVLKQNRNIFVEYLSKKGFDTIYFRNLKEQKIYWGSAWRYIILNKWENISMSILRKTIFHDVRYSDYFNINEKILYTFFLIKLLLKKKFLE